MSTGELSINSDVTTTMPSKNADSDSELSTSLQYEMARIKRRYIKSKAFEIFCGLCAVTAVLILASLLYSVLSMGWNRLSFGFLSNFPSRFPDQAGIKSAIFGSVWLMVLTLVIAVPVGVACAIFLEEIMPRTRLRRLVDINIANLASVPSIVYGILGLAVFVRFLNLQRSLISAAMTLSILILPMIVIATREALRTVPRSIREAAFALGCSRWQATKSHVLPSAFSGILTGVILSLSRVVGESAPLIMVGAMSFVAFTPENIFDGFTALPIQIFNWAGRPQPEFHELSAAAIIVLLAVLLSANGIAIILRNRLQRKNLCQHL